MGKVAIQGHATRGLEVIVILEALGGKNCKCLNGTETSGFYYIDDSGVIRNSRGAGGVLSITCFTLEEFIKRFPYKIGDRVCYIPLDYNYTVVDMCWIQTQNEVYYKLSDGECFEIEAVLAKQLCFFKQEETVKIDIPKGYEFVGVDDNNQQVVLERIKPQYPTTYEDCCKVLNIIPNNKLVFSRPSEESEYAYGNLALYNAFDRLKICRDAYCKIAGGRMGLGKPWKPDWEDGRPKYGLIVSGSRVKKQKSEYVQMKFCFPTEEILDAFCENFDKPINNCKEML